MTDKTPRPDDQQGMAGKALWQLAMSEVGKWLRILKDNPDQMMFEKVGDLVRVLEMANKLLEASQAEDVVDPYRVKDWSPRMYADWVLQTMEAWLFLYASRHPGQYLKRDIHAQLRGIWEAVLMDAPLPEGTWETRDDWLNPATLKELQDTYGIASPDQENPWGD